MSHFSALALAILGRTLLLEVPDAEQRARVIDGICPLLPGEDRSVLRTTAGLPNKADPWVMRATDIAERFLEKIGNVELITIRDLDRECLGKGQRVSRAIDNWQIKFNEELIYPDSNVPEWMCDWTDPNLVWIYRADANDSDPGDEHQCRP